MPMRISGMGSGMDIDKMVSDLMKAERMPLDKLKQKKTIIGWKTDAYREINTKLSALRTSINNMKFSGDWKTQKVASSNEAIVSATVTSNATAITHNIEVSQIASGAAVSSNSISNLSLTGSAPAGLTIDATNNKFNVTLNGVMKTIVLGTMGTYTSDQLNSELQSKLDASFGANKLTVTHDAAGKFSFTPNDSSSQVVFESVSGNGGLSNLGFNLAVNSKPSYKINKDVKISELAGASKFATPWSAQDGNFSINGQLIEYTGNDTLSTIMSKVNSSAAGVTMYYDEVTDKVIMTSKQSGKSAQINVDLGLDNGGLLKSLGFTSSVAETGKDLELKIDGVTSERPSNIFTLDGVTYNIKNTGTASVSVSQDTESMVSKIKDFVTKYNDSIDLMNQRYKEDKYKDFPPLTDDQRSGMKDTDIKLWEDKAKSGLLSNDTLISKTMSDLRSFTSATVTSNPTNTNALYQIGIETVPYDPTNPQNAGKLFINEDRLRQAISNDPNSVISLFANQSSNSSEVGIAQRMLSRLNSSIEEFVGKAGATGAIVNDRTKTLGLQMFQLDQSISAFDGKLKKKEDFYYKQFSAMDKAIQNGNAQMSWLSQKFNMG